MGRVKDAAIPQDPLPPSSASVGSSVSSSARSLSNGDVSWEAGVAISIPVRHVCSFQLTAIICTVDMSVGMAKPNAKIDFVDFTSRQHFFR